VIAFSGPDHTEFRLASQEKRIHNIKRFLKELKGLFTQILRIAHEMGLTKPECVSLDGTKIKPNASKHHALSGGVSASSKNNSGVKLRNCADSESRIMPSPSGGFDQSYPEQRFTEREPLLAPGDPVTQMKHRLKTMAGKPIYAKRKSRVESVFGLIKSVMGFPQYLLRGLKPVAGAYKRG